MHSAISVNEQHFRISVSSTHTFDDGDGIAVPCLIDTDLISSIHFSFSGTVDHSTQISPKDMLRASIVQSFRRYLTVNAEPLGIIDISEVVLGNDSSGSSGIPTVFVTPARCTSLRVPPHAHVLSIHFTFNWKPFPQLSSDLSIFSPQTLLPLQPALNRLMRKLFSVLIVGRHPWLFGPLRTKLHLERQWFPSLARSLVAIADRSGNLTFRNKVHALNIKCQVSVCKEVTGDTCGHLSTRSMSWSCSSDLPAPDTYDTLILALELVLKLAARPPPFKDACLPIVSTQSSDDETFSLPGLHHPSQDLSGDRLHWDDVLPSDPCLSGDSWTHQSDDNLWISDSEEMIAGDDKLDAACRLPRSEDAGLILLDIPLTSQSFWDPNVDEEEDSEFTSCDVSQPRTSEPCTVISGLTFPASHEIFVPLDRSPDASPGPCMFDEDGGGNSVMLLTFD